MLCLCATLLRSSAADPKFMSSAHTRKKTRFAHALGFHHPHTHARWRHRACANRLVDSSLSLFQPKTATLEDIAIAPMKGSTMPAGKTCVISEVQNPCLLARRVCVCFVLILPSCRHWVFRFRKKAPVCFIPRAGTRLIACRCFAEGRPRISLVVLRVCLLQTAFCDF